MNKISFLFFSDSHLLSALSKRDEMQLLLLLQIASQIEKKIQPEKQVSVQVPKSLQFQIEGNV